MKRILAIAVFAISMNLHASLGLHGGPNMHDVSLEPNTPTTRTTKLLVGAHLEIPLILGLSFVPEVNYKDSGTKYLAFPLMGRFYLFPAFIKPFVTAGPEFAFAIGDNGGRKGTDFLVNVGAGLAITLLPKVDLWAQGRYSFGLTNVLDTAVPGLSMKNRDLQILFGLTWHFSDSRN